MDYTESTMNKISYEEYAAMTAAFRKETGLADMLIKATQKAFGGVSEVIRYHGKGLVIFCTGERWIFNYNKLYPTFYNVTDKQTAGQFKKAY